MDASSSQKDVLFDVEQLVFQRLREGATKLGLETLCNLKPLELRRWLALPLYSSHFRVNPQHRTDTLATVMMYDEASKMIASIDVAYVASLCIAGHFHSVPIVFSAAPNGTEIGTTACTYLNTSLHQSQVVTSPGFVMVEHARTSMNVISFAADGTELRRMTM